MLFFTKKECDEWYDNRLINPRTKRPIKHEGSVYKRLKNECRLHGIDCVEWFKNRHVNPITKRRLDLNAKNGIFKQLLSICANKDEPPAFEKKPSEEQKQHLIKTVKKYIQPILNKSNSLDTRIQYTKIIKNHLKTFTKNTCIEKHNGKLVLINDDNKMLTFMNRIGSESVNGVAYLNSGTGFSKLLKFSTKMMSSTFPYHTREVMLLRKMSELVEKRICPNMPIVYDVIECETSCTFDECPEVTKSGPHYIVINELANYDVFEFLRKKRNALEMQSVYMQMILAIYTFQTLGYRHDDTHFGNFLIHETVDKSGYWEYRVNGTRIYVPNAGFTVVMWDPGSAEVIEQSDNVYIRDYDIVTFLMTHMNEESIMAEFNTKEVPNDFMVEIKKLYEYIVEEYAKIFSKLKKEDFMTNILKMVEYDEVKLPDIYINKKPQSKIINSKPYILS